jgi:pilus assembly protein CpaB
MRAISLQIDQVTGVSGFVLPGDRVDVLVTIDNAGGNNVAVTKTALQNAEVLAAGTTTEEKNKRTITTQAVTLLVDPAGAEAVALGQAQGKIHLVLRNPVDQEVVDVSPTDTRTILGIQPPKPAPAPRRERRPVVAPKPLDAAATVALPAPPPANVEPKTFTVIRDGNISQQHSATEAKPNP